MPPASLRALIRAEAPSGVSAKFELDEPVNEEMRPILMVVGETPVSLAVLPALPVVIALPSTSRPGFDRRLLQELFPWLQHRSGIVLDAQLSTTVQRDRGGGVVAIMRALELLEDHDYVAVGGVDSYFDPDGEETVIHEYTVAMEIDAAAGVVLRCAATPRVPPWQDFPAAALYRESYVFAAPLCLVVTIGIASLRIRRLPCVEPLAAFAVATIALSIAPDVARGIPRYSPAEAVREAVAAVAAETGDARFATAALGYPVTSDGAHAGLDPLLLTIGSHPGSEQYTAGGPVAYAKSLWETNRTAAAGLLGRPTLNGNVPSAGCVSDATTRQITR